MNRKEYLKKWREDNKEHIQNYKKEYAKTHDSSFKKLQDKYEQLQHENLKYKEVFDKLKRYIEGCLELSPIEDRNVADDVLDKELKYLLKIMKEVSE